MSEESVGRYMQTIVADPKRGDGNNAEGVPGNCWQAAIAYLTGAGHLDEVPHFVHEYEDLNRHGMDWWAGTQAYIRGLYGDDYVLEWWKSPEEALLPGSMIATGPSPRGDFHHAVILRQDGRMIHDPHPSGAGLERVEAVYQVVHRDAVRREGAA